jgi:hypothetical protein
MQIAPREAPDQTAALTALLLLDVEGGGVLRGLGALLSDNAAWQAQSGAGFKCFNIKLG